MNQRVGKSLTATLEFRSFLYDLSGNMLREETNNGDWSEYIYLGGHRLAMIEPATGGAGGVGCQGGCTIIAQDNFATIAINTFVYTSGLILITVIIYRKKKRIKGIIILSVLSGSIIGLSYISSKAQPADFAIYWYLNDHLDTPMRMVDEYGNLVYDVKLDPFGNVVAEESPVQNNFRFPGQYHDRESGLYYNWNRYYISQFGRYNRADPIGNAGGSEEGVSNLFVYTDNNPLIYFDASGLIMVGNSFSINEKRLIFAAYRKIKYSNLCNCAFKTAFGRTPWNDDYVIEKGDQSKCQKTGNAGYCCPWALKVGKVYICLSNNQSVDDLAHTLAHEISHRSFGTSDDPLEPKTANEWANVCIKKTPLEKWRAKAMGIECCLTP